MNSESRVMEAIREKVEAGQRLSFEDGLALEASNDLFALGSMANLVRERYNGNSRITTSTRTSIRRTSASTPATSARSGPTWARLAPT